MKRFYVFLMWVMMSPLLWSQDVVPTDPSTTIVSPVPGQAGTNDSTSFVSKNPNQQINPNQRLFTEVKPVAEVKPAQVEVLSSVETLYQQLLGADNQQVQDKQNQLRQFGYPVTASLRLPVGGNVMPDYIVGPGDELTLFLWGDPVDLGVLKPLVRLEVSKSGGLFFPPVGLIPAMGVSLKDLQRTIRAELLKKYKHFELQLTVSQLRQFPVTVTGFVNHPGVITVTAGYTLLDALQAVGGVSKNGSLRCIVFTSADGRSRLIDLYQLLIDGHALKAPLTEGDSIFVPALGPTVGIVGAVQRPAIYEVLPDDSLKSVLAMAGGTGADNDSGRYRLTLIQNGQTEVTEGSFRDVADEDQPLKASALLELYPGSLKMQNGVQVDGPVFNPGWFTLNAGDLLSDVMKRVNLKADVDLEHAVVVRTDPVTDSLKALDFVPLDIKSKKSDLVLQPRDLVRFFKSDTAQSVVVFGAVKHPAIVAWSPQLGLEATLGQVVMAHDPRQMVATIFSSEGAPTKILLRDYFDTPDPPPYLLTPGSRVELSFLPANSPALAVSLTGSVARPGFLDLGGGLTLSQAIEKAGGLAQNAFLTGAILQRPQAVALQKPLVQKVTQSIQLEISALQAQLAVAVDPLTQASIKAKLSAQQTQVLVIQSDLSNNLGRVTLAMPDSLGKLKGSIADVKLVAGDRVFIPTVPSYVMVLGAVSSQTTEIYTPGMTVDQALSNAGGVSNAGDRSRLLVVRANGQTIISADYQVFFVNNFGSVKLGPGDAVVVPAKSPDSVDAWGVFKDSLNILGNVVGITANSMAILKSLGII